MFTKVSSDFECTSATDDFAHRFMSPTGFCAFRRGCKWSAVSIVYWTKQWHGPSYHHKHQLVYHNGGRQLVQVEIYSCSGIVSFFALTVCVCRYWGFVARYYTNSFASDVTSFCPENCRGLGTCVAGQCSCNPGTAPWESTAYLEQVLA